MQEFSIEIPDKEADAIHSSKCLTMPFCRLGRIDPAIIVDKAVEYILSQPDGKLALSSSFNVTDGRHSALRRIGLAGETLVCFAEALGGSKACVV